MIKISYTTERELRELLSLSSGVMDFGTQAQSRLRLSEDRLISKHIRIVFGYGTWTNDDTMFIRNTSFPFIFEQFNEYYENIVKRMWERELKCSKCGKDVVYRRAVPRGNLNAKYFFIGEAPGVSDGEKPLERAWAYGRSSDVLRKTLFNMHILNQSWFSNLLKCSLPNNVLHTNVFPNCFSYLLNEIKYIKPKYILLMGSSVQNFAKNLLSTVGAKIVNIQHPSYCLYKGIHIEKYACMIERALRC